MAISPIRRMLEANNIGASQLICLFPEFRESYHHSEIELAAKKWARGGDPTFAEAIGAEVEFDGNKYTKAGELLEPITANQFVAAFPETKRLHFKSGRRMIKEVSLINLGKTYKDEVAGRIVTPDRLFHPKPTKHHVGIECKFTRYNTGGKHGDPEEGGMPSTATLVQIAGQMDYFDAQLWFAGVCVGGVDYWFYKIERDYDMQNLILETRLRAEKFIDILRNKDWQKLMVDDSDIWKRLAFKQFPKPKDGVSITADSNVIALWKEWGELGAELREKKKRMEVLRNEVEMRMGEAKYVVDDLGNKMFNRFDVKKSIRPRMVVDPYCAVRICGFKKNGDESD